MNRPEVHDVHRRWRRLADEYDPPRVLLGEAYVLDVVEWARYYGSGEDELSLAFNFALVHARLDAKQMSAIVDATQAALPGQAWPCWAGSNHDATRLTTRWCGGDERLARCALIVLLGLRGTPVLYYGDELALANGEVPPERILDVAEPPRDPGRTPMPWTSGDGGWRDPWLPLADTTRNVEAQRSDPSSTLAFTRDLIALRKQFVREPYERLDSPQSMWAWRRGRHTVAVNLGSRDARIEAGGDVLLASDRGREGTRFDGHLPPASAVILRT
jgi:alpha-glucosidase